MKKSYIEYYILSLLTKGFYFVIFQHGSITHAPEFDAPGSEEATSITSTSTEWAP